LGKIPSDLVPLGFVHNYNGRETIMPRFERHYASGTITVWLDTLRQPEPIPSTRTLIWVGRDERETEYRDEEERGYYCEMIADPGPRRRLLTSKTPGAHAPLLPPAEAKSATLPRRRARGGAARAPGRAAVKSSLLKYFQLEAAAYRRRSPGTARRVREAAFTKLVKSNGRELLVYDIGEPILRLSAALGPIKLHGAFIVADAVARDWIRRLAGAQSEPALWGIADRAP
jgi:hypothetical protein